MKLYDKIYWSKLVFGLLMGILTTYMNRELQISPWIVSLMFALSAYLLFCRAVPVLFRMGHIDPTTLKKVYTTGIGTFFVMWLFVWVVLHNFVTYSYLFLGYLHIFFLF